MLLGCLLIKRLLLAISLSDWFSSFISFIKKVTTQALYNPSGPGTPLLNSALLATSEMNAGYSGGLLKVTLAPQLLVSATQQLT